ncbi:predicted protein [Histoplasma capsulatum var. duboisii H88]|uniref:Predicted protein n=2 Tax=Ajellomyces capsulatus TaxID=5037 RepID=F0UR29_AJEC8|nr:predicted protein [Histoplasma capsulatum H143]EGC48356.1 predicted protein [Histoplasma capsulatum var. duboisii H88]
MAAVLGFAFAEATAYVLTCASPENPRSQRAIPSNPRSSSARRAYLIRDSRVKLRSANLGSRDSIRGKSRSIYSDNSSVVSAAAYSEALVFINSSRHGQALEHLVKKVTHNNSCRYY